MENNNVYVSPETSEVPEKKPSNGMSIAALVLGILSIPVSCCYGIGTLLAIVGLILAIVGMKKNKGGLATAALVLNIIGLIFGVIMIIYYAVVIIAMVQSGEFQDIWNQAMNGYY